MSSANSWRCSERSIAMILRPMVGQWEVPCIERISTVEGRRFASLSVPGLLGDIQQDLGAKSLVVEIVGSLQGDQARDDFLDNLRPSFRAGEPVAFVADILTAAELGDVVIEALDVEETNEAAGSFRYRLVLREFARPPRPPTPVDELGSDLDADLGDLAKLGLDGLELPGLLGAIPDIGDPMPLLREALGGVGEALKPISGLLNSLREKLGVPEKEGV